MFFLLDTLLMRAHIQQHVQKEKSGYTTLVAVTYSRVHVRDRRTHVQDSREFEKEQNKVYIEESHKGTPDRARG